MSRRLPPALADKKAYWLLYELGRREAKKFNRLLQRHPLAVPLWMILLGIASMIVSAIGTYKGVGVGLLLACAPISAACIVFGVLLFLITLPSTILDHQEKGSLSWMALATLRERYGSHYSAEYEQGIDQMINTLMRSLRVSPQEATDLIEMLITAEKLKYTPRGFWRIENE